jgi:hypothetical protein
MALLGCALGALADANAAYEVARETREGSLLKIDWKGPGRDADSGD